MLHCSSSSASLAKQARPDLVRTASINGQASLFDLSTLEKGARSFASPLDGQQDRGFIVGLDGPSFRARDRGPPGGESSTS